jgi:hypothetical protein
MFIQVIQGEVADPEEMRAALDRWTREISPEAHGWLGTTSGVTDDGRFVAVVRFESEEAARLNSDRPDQSQWWVETSKLFGGEVTFHDCRQVDIFGQGGSDQAGFVQVIQSRISDPEGMHDLMQGGEKVMSKFRPDMIGGSCALHGDGDGATTTAYFTSEEEARAGERKEPTPEVRDLKDKERRHYVGEPISFDLHEPWLHSPR